MAHDHDPAHADRRRVRLRRASRRSGWPSGTSSSRSAPAARTTRGRASTSSTCSRTRRATCTWVTPRRTRYGDVVARYWRQQGFNVLHPIGWDSFGLPAENAAIKRGIDPRELDLRQHRAAEASFTRSTRRRSTGRAMLHTSDPEYYKWNQWLFLQAVREGPGVPQGRARSTGARTTRPCSPTSRSSTARCERCGADGRQEEAHPVVLQDHRLRRPAARRPEPARGLLAVEGPRDAAQLDRPLGRRRRRLRDRGPPRAGHGLHDAPRHAATARRSSSSRPTPTWPPSWPPGASAEVQHARSRTTSSRCRRRDRDRAPETPSARRPASSSSATRSTRSTASGCRSGPPTTCWPTTATARSWRCRPTTSATSTSRARSACRCASSSTRTRRSPARSR